MQLIKLFLVLSLLLATGCSVSQWHVSSDIPGVAENVANVHMKLVDSIPINCSPGERFKVQSFSESRITQLGLKRNSYDFKSKCNKTNNVSK